MANPVFHVGDVGTVFILEIQQCDVCGTGQLVPVDLSTAVTMDICFKSPDTTKTFTASYATPPCGLGDGTDGKIQYKTVAATDLDRDGTWQIAAKITFADGRILRSTAQTFTVLTPVCP